MIVGVPKEIKNEEYRIAVTPAGAQMLVSAGHQVLVQATAGEGSGFKDDEYSSVGASIVTTAAEVFGRSEMVVKVKEPIEPEYDLLREELVLFTYLHLASDEKLTRVLMDKKVTAIAYETIQLPDGSIPLLTPMSEVAGRLATQVAAYYLGKMHGGSGKLLGGVPGVLPCNVVVVGGGTVGINAAIIALGMGARVTIITQAENLDRLRYLSDVLHGNLETLASIPMNVAAATKEADVVIGAALIPGARAPIVVTREMVRNMKPGSVIVDVAVDQGGCVETTRPTSHSDPIYIVDDVIHYCVTNMPGMVPRTSTFALTNATRPYVLRLANQGFAKAVAGDAALAKGVNVYKGRVTHPGVAEAFGLEYTPLSQLVKIG